MVWEMRPKNRWKPFNNKNIGLLEKAYQNHISSQSEPVWTRLETGLEVIKDFTRKTLINKIVYVVRLYSILY